MKNGPKRRLSRVIAVLAAGMVAGSMLLTPAAAHLNSPLTFKHLKKHFYTKGAADTRFLNVGEAYTTAASDAMYLATVKTVVVDASITTGTEQSTDANCPSGYVAVGGGYSTGSNDPGASLRVIWNEPLVAGDNLTAAGAGQYGGATGWRVKLDNTTGGTHTYSVGVVCVT